MATTDTLAEIENIPSIRILGVRVNRLTTTEFMRLVDAYIVSGQPHQIATVNPEFVMEARHNQPFAKVLETADLAPADGAGLVWASKYLGQALPERIAGSDAVPLLAEHSAERGYRLFLLGAAPGIAARTAQMLQERYPGLLIVGTYAGSPAPEEEDVIVNMVRQAKPDILFVAYGAPKQDLWIARNKERLDVPVCMGVGGAFDFITGVAKRAPLWMRRIGLEWLHRLIHQPWRWKRMSVLPVFVWLVLCQRFRGGK